MKESIRVAAVNVGSQPGETERNLHKIESRVTQAAGEGAELVLFPELSLTGFIPNHPTGVHADWMREAVLLARRAAERMDGPAVRMLSQVAVSTGVHISAGLLEDAGNLVYNTQVLAGPCGRIWYWRKLHIPIFETPFYNGGNGLEVADTELGRIGANICFDALIPESTRLLAVQNAEIVLFPFAADPDPGTAEAWEEWAGAALHSRCVENGVFGVACNYAGEVDFCGVRQTFPGGAMILGPLGEVLAEDRTNGPDRGILLADLKLDHLTEARAAPEYLYRFRRAELYGPLAR